MRMKKNLTAPNNDEIMRVTNAEVVLKKNTLLKSSYF
jgi:hypothetical protein